MKNICLRGEIYLLAFCLLACLPRVCQLRNFPCEFTEVFCHFWPIKLHNRFISHGIGCSYFSGDFLIIPFMVYMALKILVRSRGGGAFLCLALSVNVRQFFLIWKLNILSFIFLIWMEQFWIWFSRKLKAHWQISKEWCFEKYCSCDQVCQVSALWGAPWRSYLENLTIDDKFTNKWVWLFIHQTMCWEKKTISTS